jgi:ATP-dependent exoDNAse (exonuclease V) beta subunit
VQVVTVHKSKGLEYPLVFLPFACAFRAAKSTDLPLKWHDEQGRLQLPWPPTARCWRRWTGSAWVRTCASSTSP